jgi:uncharacterized protein YdaU (DUF1376 family)
MSHKENIKARKAPAFQLYVDDFLAGTSEMSAEEVGGYIRLLCHQWTKGGIPNDEDRAGRMAGLMGSPSLRYVLAKFTPCEDGMLRNDRLERIRAEKKQYSDNQSQSGAKGAAIRWGKCQTYGNPNGLAIATPLATPLANGWPEDSSPSPSPSPNKDIGGKPPSPHDAPSIPKPRMRLEKPTLEMCIANAAEIGLPADEADQFLNHHEARGWKGIVDWKAAMRTWRGNWKKWGGGSRQQPADKPKPMWLQMKELEARIETHPGNWNWLKYNSKTATKEQKDEYKALLKQLEAMQAGQEPLPMGEGDIP